jgi:hypothetical protein
LCRVFCCHRSQQWQPSSSLLYSAHGIA